MRLRSVEQDYADDLLALKSREGLKSLTRELYRFGERATGREFNLFIIRRFELVQKQLSISELKHRHLNLSERLSREKPQSAERTSAERFINDLLQKRTNLEFHRSLWIGNCCSDFFFPGISGHFNKRPKMRGMTLEIDGPIHDTQSKMNRDQLKLTYLRSLSIGSMPIENGKVRSIETLNYVSSLSSQPRLSTRCRRRLWRIIYLETLVQHGSTAEISEHIGLPVDAVEQLAKLP